MVDLQCVDISDERVAVGYGVSVPRSWTAILRGEPDVPGEIQVHAVYEPRLRRVVAAEVRVLRGGDEDEVTSLTLREVRVQQALQMSGIMVSTVAEADHPEVGGARYIVRMRERTDRTAAEVVADAARLYTLAATVNLPPLRTVADGLQVSQSTATRLMGRARAAGSVPGLVSDPAATGPYLAPSPTSAGGPSIG